MALLGLFLPTPRSHLGEDGVPLVQQRSLVREAPSCGRCCRQSPSPAGHLVIKYVGPSPGCRRMKSRAALLATVTHLGPGPREGGGRECGRPSCAPATDTLKGKVQEISWEAGVVCHVMWPQQDNLLIYMRLCDLLSQPALSGGTALFGQHLRGTCCVKGNGGGAF